jgi:hypothetical protein
MNEPTEQQHHGINNSCSGEMLYVCAKPLYLGPSVLFRVETSENDHHNESFPTTLFGATSTKSFSGQWMVIRYWHEMPGDQPSGRQHVAHAPT